MKLISLFIPILMVSIIIFLIIISKFIARQVKSISAEQGKVNGGKFTETEKNLESQRLELMLFQINLLKMQNAKLEKELHFASKHMAHIQKYQMIQLYNKRESFNQEYSNYKENIAIKELNPSYAY